MMKALGKYAMGVMLTMVMVVGSQSAMAEDDYANDTARPSGGAMVADALLARPLLAVATVGGAAVFLVSLPFSALGGNVDAAAETLIKTPAEATFRRCLGCEMSHRAGDSPGY